MPEALGELTDIGEDQPIDISSTAPVPTLNSDQMATGSHPAYSFHEPHYQQMHPLIYFDDTPQQIPHHGNQYAIHHLQSHPHSLASTSNGQIAHHWDHEHFIHMPMMIPFGDTSNRPEFLPIASTETPPSTVVSSNDANANLLANYSVTDIHDNEIIVTTSSISDQNSPSMFTHLHHIDNLTSLNQIQPSNNQPQGSNRNMVDKNENLEEIGLVEADLLNEISQHSPNQIVRASQSPIQTNRELHNEIERRRRSRIKSCCEVLRSVVPGLNEKTDKATVLEHTVKFVNHLINCPEFKCRCDF